MGRRDAHHRAQWATAIRKNRASLIEDRAIIARFVHSIERFWMRNRTEIQTGA